MKYVLVLAAALAAFFLYAGCGTTTDSCLAEGTLVSTPEGDVAIQDLRVGDAVWSIDPTTSERIAARVVKVRSALRTCWQVTTASGCRVVATHDHPFYAPQARRYMELGTLAARADRCLLSCSERLEADRIVDLRPVRGKRRVYDITLDGELHNFLAGGVLVHNKSQPFPLISDVVTIENVATMDQAVFEPDFLDGLGMGTIATLTRDPSSGGVGVVHVMSTEAFDTLLIASSSVASGTLRLALPMSVMTADLRVTLAPPRTTVTLTIVPVRTGVEAMPAAIDVPADG